MNYTQHYIHRHDIDIFDTCNIKFQTRKNQNRHKSKCKFDNIKTAFSLMAVSDIQYYIHIEHSIPGDQGS